LRAHQFLKTDFLKLIQIEPYCTGEWVIQPELLISICCFSRAAWCWVALPFPMEPPFLISMWTWNRILLPILRTKTKIDTALLGNDSAFSKPLLPSSRRNSVFDPPAAPPSRRSSWPSESEKPSMALRQNGGFCGCTVQWPKGVAVSCRKKVQIRQSIK
jgi:hypothetical protein